MRISRINGVGVDISGMYPTLVAHQDVPGVLAALTNLLAYAHVNIAFCRTYRTEVGGQAYSVFETDGAPMTLSSPMFANSTNVDYDLSSSPVLPALSPASRQRKLTTASSCSMCEELGLDAAVMAVREARLTGRDTLPPPRRRVLTSCAKRPQPHFQIHALVGGLPSAARQKVCRCHLAETI